jgi:hypothetical protein
MRLRRYLKNLANHVPCLNLLFISLFIFGCLSPIEPTYKEKDLPHLVKKICKDEYNLDVITERAPTTLWIYAPLSKILHKDYLTKKEDKIFDEEMLDKLRNILNTMGRVLVSSDHTPEFFALLASDINLGIDYTIVGCVLDIKKSYAGFIPWPEANRRYVIKLKIAPEAIQDTTASHLKAYDIKLPDFLAEQIAQRIAVQFQEEGLKEYFKPEKSEGRFSNDRFIFEYSIKEIAKPDKKISILKEILGIISYCIKTYEFKDFSYVEIRDSLSGDKLILNKDEILKGSML